jgi:hypothetical protein
MKCREGGRQREKREPWKEEEKEILKRGPKDPWKARGEGGDWMVSYLNFY